MAAIRPSRGPRKAVRYGLSVMAPGSYAGPPPRCEGQELLRVHSERPFRNIRVGDEIIPRRWLSRLRGADETLSGMFLRVTKVRHVIAEGDHLVDHLTVLYTEDARRPVVP